MKFDLSAYRAITVHPVNGAVGAEIGGVDAGRALSPEVARELCRALSQFNVLFFRDQQLDIPGLARFAKCFGTLGASPLNDRQDDELALISRMVREAEVPGDVRVNGDRWHMDRAGDERPPRGFLLYCEEAPDYGGDTLFAGLAAAYDGLSPEMQRWCAGLTGVHSMSGIFEVEKDDPDRPRVGPGKRRIPWTDPDKVAFVRQEAEHPLVCAHPETGRPFLFVTGAYLLRIKELAAEESAALIDALNTHVVQPEFTCRFRWRKGSMAVLDNRCTQHYAVNDYAGFKRQMLRAELAGDWRPVRAEVTEPGALASHAA